MTIDTLSQVQKNRTVKRIEWWTITLRNWRSEGQEEQEEQEEQENIRIV